MIRLVWLVVCLQGCTFISEEELAFRQGGVAGCDIAWYLDDDADNYGAGVPIFACSSPGSDYVEMSGDCDDSNVNISPAMPEDCATAFDDDCDGTSNGDGENVLDCTNWYADIDGDGFGSNDNFICDCSASGIYLVTETGDCEDQEETVNPSSDEVCGDGLDNNCDGLANGCGLDNPYDLSASRATYLGSNIKDYAGSRVVFGGVLSSGNAVVITAMGVDGSSSDVGAIYLLPVEEGQIDISTQASAVILGEESSSLGDALLADQDLNGDGIDDLVIGAPTYASNVSNVGAVYTFYGPLEGELSITAADSVILGEYQNDRFGESLSVGDVLNSGVGQLIIGVPNHDSAAVDAGAVLIYDESVQSEALLSDADQALYGGSAGDRFGHSIAEVRDLNGDGIGDLAVGAYGVNGNKGAAYVFWGPIVGGVNSDAADVAWVESVANASAGSVLQSIGDVTGDGYGNLAIGARNADRVYVTLNIESGMNSLSDAEVFIAGPTDSSTGSSLAYVGDINGDRQSDVLIGAYIGSSAYVLYGPLMGAYDLAVDAVQLQDSAVDQVGTSVYGAGDINGDSISDILIGARISSINSNRHGAVFLVEGVGL